jgi:hypothetical protein
MISRSIYNLKIDTICPISMCYIPFDRSILQLSNGIRHVMPSTDRKLELTAKASMAQPRPTAGCVFQWVNVCTCRCELIVASLSNNPTNRFLHVPAVAAQLIGRVRTVTRILFTALKKTDLASELTYITSPPYTLLRRL